MPTLRLEIPRTIATVQTDLGWIAVRLELQDAEDGSNEGTWGVSRLAFGHRSAADANQAVQTEYGRAVESEYAVVAAQPGVRGALRRLQPVAVERAGRLPRAPKDPAIRDVLELLKAYAQGDPVDLHQIRMALPPATPFKSRVRAACQKIPRGQTRSYAELAAAAGSPGAARAVGSVMSGNPVPLLIPCHRVVASGGRLGGFSAPQGLDMKRRLLALEAT